MRRQSLLALLGCMLLSGCVSPTSATKPVSPEPLIENVEVVRPEPSAPPAIPLNVLGVVKAQVESVTLGASFWGYPLPIYVPNLDLSETRYLGPEGGFSRDYYSPTSTPSVYLANDGTFVGGEIGFCVPDEPDEAEINLSLDGRSPEKLCHDANGRLLALYSVLPGDSPYMEKALSYNLGGEYVMAEFHSQIPREDGLNDRYYTMKKAGTRMAPPQYRLYELRITVSVQDNNGEPVENLTRENFRLDLSPKATGIFSALEAQGEGVYVITQLVGEPRPTNVSPLVVRVFIENSPALHVISSWPS